MKFNSHYDVRFAAGHGQLNIRLCRLSEPSSLLLLLLSLLLILGKGKAPDKMRTETIWAFLACARLWSRFYVCQ